MPKLNAIAVLGGGLIRDKGKWRTTNFNEKGDKFGALGDRLRVVAAAYLYEKNPDLTIIASGGRGQVKIGSTEPAVATVIAGELEELKVPADKIIKETKSKNTCRQLAAIQNIISEKNISSAVVISNRYHLPRLKAMVNHFSELGGLKKKYGGKRLIFRSAEEIVLKYDKEKWRQIVKNAYESEGMKKRISREKKGARDIIKGEYKFN